MINSDPVIVQYLERMSLPKMKNTVGTSTMRILCLMLASPILRVAFMKPKIGIEWFEADCNLISCPVFKMAWGNFRKNDEEANVRSPPVSTMASTGTWREPTTMPMWTVGLPLEVTKGYKDTCPWEVNRLCWILYTKETSGEEEVRAGIEGEKEEGCLSPRPGIRHLELKNLFPERSRAPHQQNHPWDHLSDPAWMQPTPLEKKE